MFVSSGITEALVNCDLFTFVLYSGVPLNPGYLVTGCKEMAVEVVVMEGTSTRGIPKTKTAMESLQQWTGLEFKDCTSDAEVLRKQLLESFESRKSCIHPAFEKLLKCMDFTEMLVLLCGRKNGEASPFDPIPYATYGVEEFISLVAYVATCSRIQGNKYIVVHPVLGHKIYDK